MKKLLFAACALAAISLLAPDSGYAQPWENRIGIYTTADAASANLNVTPIGHQISLYFVVYNPRIPNPGSYLYPPPMPAVDGFEFKVSIVPESGFFVLSQNKPAGTVDQGAGHVGGTYDYNASWPSPWPVVNGMVKVMDWLFLPLAPGPFNFYLGPPNVPSIAGSMSVKYTDDEETVYWAACSPSSGSTTVPVFVMGGENPVGAESSSFGNVKALFR